ncbi:HlyD family efflux transporter periplasmic adaptor subunit [Mucilaginibacter achroorhodeus]|uniref:HlyD family efflux transporter periplasmic adaptor subunit n=1 Tax=Mucilaginibacter achroorhodeus TaxID=2599294 RepID=A0A563TXZ3_9SPHI|nr:HlyD family efflux transporter periplasmic adaptor subunit [Mucilaginibacter achroorhodeus]TWR24196.1 HlyD family efflux transporter periplasmic adaptor subunit [Mucilaginibacter achroorhodeus]
MDTDDKIFPAEFMSNTAEFHFQKYNPKSNILYRMVLGFVLVAFAAIFFVKVNINVKSLGTIKSTTERTDLKALVSGRIDSMNLKENMRVTKGQILVKLTAAAINEQQQSAVTQQGEYTAQLADLEVLTNMAQKNNWSKKPQLASSLYGQQFALLLQKARDAKATLELASKNNNRYDYLFRNKAISAAEYDAVHLQYQNALSALQLIYDDQASIWQADLNNLKSKLRSLASEGKYIEQEKDLYTLRAPVSGTLQNLKGVQTGSVIAGNEVIAEISPDNGMIAEVYVLPKDVGLIRPDNKVNFQVDAFNYNQWGLLTGKVITVSNDIFTDSKQQPYFKVRCLLDKTELKLKNGYAGHIKKGMTLQANFFVTRRTLFQLLYDKTSDWLNPGRLPAKETAQL